MDREAYRSALTEIGGLLRVEPEVLKGQVEGAVAGGFEVASRTGQIGKGEGAEEFAGPALKAGVLVGEATLQDGAGRGAFLREIDAGALGADGGSVFVAEEVGVGEAVGTGDDGMVTDEAADDVG